MHATPTPPKGDAIAAGSPLAGSSSLAVFAAVLFGLPGCAVGPQNELSDDDDAAGVDDDDDSAVSPTAVCPPSMRVEVGGLFGVSLSGSSHPESLALTYNWTVQAPSGETIEPLWSYDTEATYQARMPGTYAATGTVQATDGSTALCSVEIEAEVIRALLVTANWEFGGDVDLHLRRAGGEWFGDDDCHYQNCPGNPFEQSLDWGEPGSSTDDPWRGLDSLSGPGYEQVGIPDPTTAPADSPYTIGLDFRGDEVRPTQGVVTVEVWLHGMLEAEYEFAAPAAPDIYCVGSVDWNNQQFLEAPLGCA